MQLCQLLVLSYACLQFLYPYGAGEEDIINPDDLARQLRSEICTFNDSLAQSFYKALRDRENRDYQFPIPEKYNGQAFGKYANHETTINWLIGGDIFRLNILQPYFGPWLSNLTSDILTWCIYPLSTTTNIHGCINSTHRWSTPEFEALGFLHILSLRNDTTRTPFKRGDLQLDLSHDPYLRLSALQGAFVSATVRIPDTNATTIGVYYRLNLERSTQSYVIGISSQSEAFLIEGQEKNFTCESYVHTFEADVVAGYSWYEVQNGNDSLVDPWMANYTGSLYQQKYRIKETVGCKLLLGQNSLFGHYAGVLTFVSPTVNDTGEFKCVSGSSRGYFLYIDVVFTKLPTKKILLTKGSSSLIVCEMKAPSDSSVYWTHKPVNKEAWEILSLNDSDAILYETEELMDDRYSMFRLELQIPEVSFDHLGEYSCNVEYPAGPRKVTTLIQQFFTVFVDDKGVVTPAGKGGELTEFQLASVLVGTFLLCFLVGGTVTVVLILWMSYIKKSKHKKRPLQLSKCQLSAKNEIYHEMGLLSPGIMKSPSFEFPRSNLELQDVLGEGRFGKVYKGKAYGIVPDAPNLNTVAVKTTASDTNQLHSCIQRLLSELEIMTMIQPQDNICNLLASCTSPDGPFYVIMEYASYGNLKSYLEKCRDELLKKNISIHIGSDAERVNLQQFLISCDTDSEDSLEATSPKSETCGDVLHFSTPSPKSSVPEANLGYDKLQDVDTPCAVEEEKAEIKWSTGYDRLIPVKEQNFDSTVDVVYSGKSNSLITNANVSDFAHQIASGLQHLESMNIVHCDLAARNILIAEGFLLKIGDFGMARCVASDYDSRYQRVQAIDDSMVAIKWAAVEVLENDLYSFKSDIWSFATVIWEIATYGSRPFADFALGASLEPFISYLKDGNRPSHPKGLSDPIYGELCSCWSADPSIRPSASELVAFFQQQMGSEDLPQRYLNENPV